MLRTRAGQVRHVYYSQHHTDRDLTPDMLASKEARRALAKHMVVVNQNITRRAHWGCVQIWSAC